MKSQIRLFAGAITLSGAAVLMSAQPAHSTMSRDLLDLMDPRFCCASDANGDGKPENYCCFRSGCSVSPEGCTRVNAE